MKKTKTITSVTFSMLMPLIFASALHAQQAPQVTFGNINYGGSGCPQMSVSKMMSPDGKAFTLLFDQFVADVGPTASILDGRKACQITVPLNFPAGWTFAISSFDYRGFVQLDPGVTAMQTATYYFMGESRQGQARSVLQGPTSQDYHFHDDVATSAMVWEPCGKQLPLNIKADVRLMAYNRYASGMITLDSLDGKIAMTYGLTWRRCY